VAFSAGGGGVSGLLDLRQTFGKPRRGAFLVRQSPQSTDDENVSDDRRYPDAAAKCFHSILSARGNVMVISRILPTHGFLSTGPTLSSTRCQRVNTENPQFDGLFWVMEVTAWGWSQETVSGQR